MKKILFFMALLFSGAVFSQTVTSVWIDPCTGETKTVTADLNGSGTLVSIYNQQRVFTAQDIISGAFTAWAASTYQAYSAIGPCSQSETQTQATTQAVQQTAQEAAKAATTAAVAAPATPSPPVQTTTQNPTTNATNQTQSTNTGSQGTDQSTTNTGNSSGNGDGGTDSSTGSTGSEDNQQQDTSNDSTNQGTENTDSENQQSSDETTSSSESEGGESDSSETENTEGEEGDSGESSEDEQTEEEVEEESTEEESSEEEQEEEQEETTEEESEEEEEEPKKKKKKKKAKNTNPPIVVANLSTMESLDKRFNTAFTFGISRSSLRGDKNYGLTSMVWTNFKQYMVMGNFSKVFFSEGRPKFVYSTSLMASRMFTTTTGGNNHSFVYLGDKGGVYGISLGATAIYLNYEIKDGGILFDQALLSGAVTSFFTKPYNFDRLSVSPMVAVSAPFLNYDMYQRETTYNKDLMIITGASANYALTKKFFVNLGVNVSHNTNKDIRSLLNFTIGSRFSF